MSASHTELPALDPVLAGVYRRGYAIRRQRTARRLATGVVALQLLVAIPFALAHGDDGDGRNVRVVAPATQDETTTSTTAVPTVVEGVAVEAATTTTTAPAATPAPTTTLVCRNSSDPRCGPFRWDPAPAANQPMTVELTFSPQHPRVGDEVVFSVHFHDPDAAEASGGFGPCFGDDTPCVSSMRLGPRCDMYGPWDPPTPHVGDWAWQFTHVYERAGAFELSTSHSSADGTCTPDGVAVFGSTASAKVTVVVDP